MNTTSHNLTVLMVSSDTSAFDEASALRSRLRLYAQHTDSLFVLVASQGPYRTCSEPGLSIQSVASRFGGIRFLHLLRSVSGIPSPHLVTSQDPFFLGCAAWLLSRHFHVPLELQVHTDVFSRGFVSHSFSNRIRMLLALFLLKRAHHVRTVSKRVAESIHARAHVPRDRISIVPILAHTHISTSDSVVSSLKEKMPRCRRLALMVVRLAPEKDISLALRSLSFARSQGADLGLVIVGDGPLRQKLEHEATLLGLKDSVIFVGQVLDPTAYYKCADVLLLTSRYEGYGLVLAEAARMGLPIISTDVGIASEVGAYIVDATPESISHALQLSSLPSPHVEMLPRWTEAEYVSQIVGVWHSLYYSGQSVLLDTRKYMIYKYVVSGGFASSLNLLLLYILTDFFGLWYVLSASFSYPVGYFTSFFLQKFWTFRDSALQGIPRQFFIFIAIGLINIALNASLLYLVVETLHLHYLLGQIVVGVCIAIWSFLAYRILFHSRI